MQCLHFLKNNKSYIFRLCNFFRKNFLPTINIWKPGCYARMSTIDIRDVNTPVDVNVGLFTKHRMLHVEFRFQVGIFITHLYLKNKVTNHKFAWKSNANCFFNLTFCLKFLGSMNPALSTFLKYVFWSTFS